jgi:2-keto-4-pentenoate hydratase/2-oxohepta-3-ene-1,7-dioic acid hydratase in catechol pathway
MLRFIRFQTKLSPPQFGWFFENRIGPIEGSIFNEYRRSEATIPVESVTLLPPINPGKIICIGRNYVAHAREENTEVPELPIIFLKPPSSIIGPNETIYLPPQSQQVEHEAELVIVIGKRGRWILPGEALQYILGYTIGNDITARDLQRRDGQWTRGKGFDTFCPIGPWIITEFDPTDAMITCHVNDELRQMASTRDMVFRIPQLIAFISSIMTLEPGDLIFTGTPAGVGPLVPGNIIEISIEGIGTLRNSVALEPTH